MKTTKQLLAIGFLLIPCIVFSQGTEIRKPSSFTKIEVSGAFDTFVEQGNEESVKIEAEGIDPKKIITEVNQNILKVYVEKGNYQNIRTKVYITYKRLEGIARGGSGDLNCKSDISATNVKISSSGSGNITIKGKIKAQQHLVIAVSGSGDAQLGVLAADDLDLSISGSGDVQVSSGDVKKQSLSISGSGDISAFGLKSDVCSISIAGSGDVNVTANKSLEATIAGSGDVNYKGNAQLTKSRITGSGEIKRH